MPRRWAVEPGRARSMRSSSRASQVYGDTAIVTYTLLVRSVQGATVTRTQQNETRVYHRFDEGWKLVHCHKSPCWRAPHDAPL